MNTSRWGASPVSRETAEKIVRESRFDEGSHIYDILNMVFESRLTGTLFIDFNQGGIGSVRFREESAVKNYERS